MLAEDEAIGQWRTAAMVTDLDLPALQIWRMYRGWAECENRTKELDYDFAAALHTVMQQAFNLMSLFRQVLLKQILIVDGTDRPILHTLSTLRHQRFAQPSHITQEGRRHILKLATAMQKA